MAHVFNYLLSESTFAFEVSGGRMRAGGARRMEILSYALYFAGVRARRGYNRGYIMRMTKNAQAE